jgi:hypothetical protein
MTRPSIAAELLAVAVAAGFLLPGAAVAGRKCRGEAVLRSIVEGEHPSLDFELGEPKPTPEALARVQEIIFGIDDFVRPAFRPPRELKITLRASGSEAFQSPGSLTVPHQLVTTRGLVRHMKHPAHTRAVIAHEYGHALFAEAMAREFPELERLKLERKQLFRERIRPEFGELLAAGDAKRAADRDLLVTASQELREEHSQATARLEELFRKTRDNLKPQQRVDRAGRRKLELAALRQRRDEVEAQLLAVADEGVRARYVEATARYREAMKRVEAIGGMNVSLDPPDIETAYDELFADVVAVLHDRDGRAVMRSSMYSGPHDDFGKIRARARMRDFTRRHSVKGWKETNPHVLYGPVRSHLWRTYLSHPGGMEDRAGTLKKVFDAIREEIRERHAVAELYDLAPEAANERLIRRIDERFASPLTPEGSGRGP